MTFLKMFGFGFKPAFDTPISHFTVSAGSASISAFSLQKNYKIKIRNILNRCTCPYYSKKLATLAPLQKNPEVSRQTAHAQYARLTIHLSARFACLIVACYRRSRCGGHIEYLKNHDFSAVCVLITKHCATLEIAI